MMIRVLTAVLFAVLTASANAYEVETLVVTHNDGHYTVNFSVRLATPADKIRALAADYANLAQLSDMVTESRVLAVNGDITRLKLVLRACVLFFCKTAGRVEDITTEANGDITTRALPEQSDFRSATERWRIRSEGSGTRFVYHAELEPAFFVPPILGPLVLRYAIRRELRETAARFERLGAAP